MKVESYKQLHDHVFDLSVKSLTLLLWGNQFNPSTIKWPNETRLFNRRPFYLGGARKCLFTCLVGWDLYAHSGCPARFVSLGRDSVELPRFRAGIRLESGPERHSFRAQAHRAMNHVAQRACSSSMAWFVAAAPALERLAESSEMLRDLPCSRCPTITAPSSTSASRTSHAFQTDCQVIASKLKGEYKRG